MTRSKAKQKQTQPDSDNFRIFWRDSLDPHRTDRFIDWLDQNPTDWHELFSDSIQDANAEGRRTDSGKTAKAAYHRRIAEHVFSNDKNPAYVLQYRMYPEKFQKSVADHIGK